MAFPVHFNLLQFLPMSLIVLFMLIQLTQSRYFHCLGLHLQQYNNNLIRTQLYMGQTQQKQTAFEKVKRWFVQLSFWKKIIIIFTLNTCILLILTDAIMLVLFNKISNDIIDISNSQKDIFNQVSNTQIVQVTSRMILSEIDFYANLLVQLTSAYTYFNQNPNIYTSLQGTNPQNPKYTSSFPNISYTEPAYYIPNNETTFTPLPYIDQMLPMLLTSNYYQETLQRINVYILNGSNSNDLGVRTFPATDNFIVPSITSIINRFIAIPEGNFNISAPYTDTLTKNSSKNTLVALRTVLPSADGTQKLMFEVQLQQSMFVSLLQQIYYFPSTSVLLVQQVGKNYTYFSAIPSTFVRANISDYYKLGSNRVSVTVDVTRSSVSVTKAYVFTSATVGIANSYVLGVASTVTNQTSDPLRCAIVVNVEETQKPANDIQVFLESESNILMGIVLAWSFIILLSTVALATVVGNYIFYNLKMLSTKMDQYIKDPSKFHNIVIELKELDLKGILKRLSDNLISIIEKIEVRKKQRKDRINQNYHPLSIGEPKFQERQQLNDYEIIDQIKEEVKAKVQILKQEAAEKEKIEKAEKEKVEKEEHQRIIRLQRQISQEITQLSHKDEDSQKMLNPKKEQ